MTASRKQCRLGQSCQIATLADALYHQAHHGAKPLPTIADEIGVRPGYLSDAANADREDVQFQARLIVPLCRATDDLTLLRFMASQLGCVLVNLPAVANSDCDISKRFIKLAKELGDVGGEIDRALAGDDDISNDEFLRIDGQLSELTEATAQLRHVLLKKAGRA